MTISSGSVVLAADQLRGQTASGYLAFAASSELTIASGAVTANANFYRVDTESDAASDDLDTITAGAEVRDGFLLFLRAENAARTVVVKHNTGNILCMNGRDQTLDDVNDIAVLIYDSNQTKWLALGLLGPGLITATELAASVAGAGLTGGAGTALAVVVDDSTIEINTDTLRVKAAGITASHLATSVAGNGLTGGGGTALAVNVDGTSIQISGDALSAFIVAGTSVNDYFRITAATGIQKLVMGNQDGGGASNPSIITAANGALNFGGGDSWTADGGTFAAKATLTDGGMLLVGDTTNANMTVGLTLNQGAADDEILALKSSDVSHGVTDIAETDTYGYIRKSGPTDGGLWVGGISEATGSAIVLEAITTTDDTTKSTSGTAPVYVYARKKSGTGAGAVGADGNLMVIANNGTTRFIFDAEGSAHADVEWTTFDTHNDVALLESLERAMLDPVRDAFGAFVSEHRQRLQELGIVNFYDDGPRAMVNMTRLTMLLVGAVRQVSKRLDNVMDRLENVERKLLTA